MSKERSIYLLLLISALMFAGVTLAHNLIAFQNYCYPAYDLGIYMEAVQKFGAKSWNPFLSTLGIGFLNDHWHPALILAKPLTLIFRTSTSLFLTEIFFVLMTAFIPLYLVKKNLLRLDLAALISMYLVLNQREFEAAMAFPVHPAVWANFILLFATALILKKGSESLVFFLLFIAGFFGEQFSFCLLGYSLVFFAVSERKKSGFSALLFSVLWVWFCVGGRAFLVGPILHQTDRVALSFASFTPKYAWDRTQLKNLIKFFIEFLPLTFVLVKAKRYLRPEKSSGVLIAGIFIPLVVGRILSGSFGHQYDTLLVAAVGAFALWLLARSERFALSTGFLAGVLVFFFCMSYSKFEQAYGVISGTKLQSCIHSREAKDIAPVRARELSKIFADAAEKNPQEIFALGNLVPNLVEKFPDAQVICLGMPSQASEPPDWLILERGICGDPWPFDQSSLEAQRTALMAKFPELQVSKESPCIFSAQKK